MIEVRGRPAISRMAACTVASELPVMCIVRCMTCGTILGSVPEQLVGMAASAFQRDMPAGQSESSLIVVESDLRPLCCSVTCGAILSQLTVVRIITFVTGETIAQRAFE